LPLPKKRKEKKMENTMQIVNWGRYFALYDQEELVCVTVYKKGAQEVRRRIEELKAKVEMAKDPQGLITTETGPTE
jgi:hypothetical protein